MEKMMNSQPLDVLPIWSVSILTVIVLFLTAEAGFRLVKLVQKRWPDKGEAGVGTVVGAALALLGFLLAFVASIAIGNFNQRRQLVVSEANAIGTTYLRAGYLADPYGTESRDLLREYVNLRVKALDPAQTEAAIARSEQIHDELWLLTEKALPEHLRKKLLDEITPIISEALDEAKWEEQFQRSGSKLLAIAEAVKDQLSKGGIEPISSLTQV